MIEAVGSITSCFKKNNIDTPALDARVLVQSACFVDEVELAAYGDRKLSAQNEKTLMMMVKQRLAHRPVSRIINKREFYGLSFRLSKGTLDPRPDSETLIDVSLAKLKVMKHNVSILDLGTGSGCLLLALLAQLPQAWGLGVDVSATALRTARLNASLNNLRKRAFFRQCRWLENAMPSYDIIISNPPYISFQQLETLAPEVKDYEPRRALVADKNGLGDFERIIKQAECHLNPNGWLGFEVGQGQAKSVLEMLISHKWRHGEIHKDLNAIDRVVLAQKP